MQGRATVGVEIGEEMARRSSTSRLARSHEPLPWLLDDPDTPNGPRNRGRSVRARVVYDDDLVGQSRLRQQRVKTGRNVALFVVGADDDAQRRHGRASRAEVAGNPRLIGVDIAVQGARTGEDESCAWIEPVPE